MKSLLRSALFPILALPAFAGTATSVEPAPEPASSGWSFRFAPYLWAQGLDGTMGVHDIEGDVNIGFDDILSDLDMAFMGVAEARIGRWGFMVDVNYAKLSDSFDTHGVLFDGGDFEMEQLLVNATVSWRAIETPTTFLDIYAGARINWIEIDLSLDGGKVGDVDRSGDESWVDGIVGLRFQTDLSQRWFFRAAGDIGGGSSDLTWQAMALIGYRFNESCNIGLGYRALGTDYENGGFTYDVTASGPVLGVEFHF